MLTLTTTERLSAAPVGLRRPARAGRDNLTWVMATPFRAHVLHLMSTARVPWPIIAYQAGVPLATVHTLLYGRAGRTRPKISAEAARRLLEVRTTDLSWLRVAQVSAERAGARIRSARSHHVSWSHLADFLHLDEATCQAMARGERTSCSLMVDILAQLILFLVTLDPTRDRRA
jgi:hypothetical protein